MNKRSYKIYLYASIFFTSAFLGILLFWIIHCILVSDFNSQVYTQEGIFADSFSDISSESDIVLSLYPRGGSTDSWVKGYDGIPYSYRNLYGTIFEMRVDNKSDCPISDWRIRQNITQPCYINNAWCGTVEIHQFDENGQEKTQLLNFNDITVKDITLDYFVSGNDLMILLNEGDYLYYYPSEEVFETVPMIPVT